MPDSNLLLHIGYHKCASTVLQDQLFARPGGPFCLPSDAPRHVLVHRFVVPQPMCFDADAMRAHYQPMLEEAARNGRQLVISHERFSGYPPSGGYDSTIIAQRLKQCFPKARVLMLIREQRASIRSMYLQYITDGGDLSLRDYLTAPEPRLKRKPAFSAEFYQYHKLIGHYRALFGADRVLCLPYEYFVRDAAGFVARLSDFTGQPAPDVTFHRQNTQRSTGFQMLQRLVNRHLSRNELSPQAAFAVPRIHRRFGALRRYPPFTALSLLDERIEAAMTRRIARTFAGAFAQSNAMTSDVIGDDLGQYGYQMPQ